MKHARALIAFLVLVSVAGATDRSTTPGYVPNTGTALTTRDAVLDRAQFSNTTGGAVTCTLTDRSANCGGSGCPFWPTISIAANQVYQVTFSGYPAPGGFTWSCSSANAVIGWVSWRE